MQIPLGWMVIGICTTCFLEPPTFGNGLIATRRGDINLAIHEVFSGPRLAAGSSVHLISLCLDETGSRYAFIYLYPMFEELSRPLIVHRFIHNRLRATVL